MSTAPATARRLRPHSRAGRIALGVLVAVVVFFWAFDWNWCRPLIRHYVMSHSGRSFEFDDLKVHWRYGLDPVIEFRGLTIQNAPWAASRQPFLHAGRIAATVSWRSLGSAMTVIEMLELDDAQVDMERRADGVRNWRLVHPDDRGPPRVRVVALAARRSQLHTIHAGIGLELDVSSTPLPAPEPFADHADLPLTQSLQFKGQLKDDPFEGSAHVSDVLAFGATPRQFSFRTDVRSGAVRLEASGLTNDVHAIGDLDCDVKLSAIGSGPAKPLPEALARLRPLAAQGHVTKTGDHWTGAGVHLRAGRQSSLVAEIDFNGNFKTDTPRRTLKATLRDAIIDLDDLWAPRDKTPRDAGHALSTQALPLDRLRELDADVDLRDARFAGAEHGLAQTLRGHAVLAGGVLKLQALDLGVADGHVTGSARVDASHAPADWAIALSARALHIDRLSPKLAANGTLQGAIDGRADLKARGDTSRALAQGASGNVTLSLADGASVSKRLDAKLGLNGGVWLHTLFDKSARAPVQCGAVTLVLARGVATSQRFRFETSDTALAGRGSVNLVDESLDGTLTPAHKKLALLSLDKSIHAEGPWHDVKIRLEPSTDAAPERCAS